MGRRALSGQRRWPRLLLGSVLLWRALSTAALASADVADPRFLAEWSSPGLNRCVKLAFASYGSDIAELGTGRQAAAEAPSAIAG